MLPISKTKQDMYWGKIKYTNTKLIKKLEVLHLFKEYTMTKMNIKCLILMKLIYRNVSTKKL